MFNLKKENGSTVLPLPRMNLRRQIAVTNQDNRIRMMKLTIMIGLVLAIEVMVMVDLITKEEGSIYID